MGQAVKSQFFLDKIVQNICFLYFIIPILMFFLGWIQPVFSAVFSILLLLGWYKSFKTICYKAIQFDSRRILLVFAINILIFIWLYLSGIGGFSLQNWDFHGRNALFHDLINYPWPVRYDYALQPEMHSLFGANGVLVYYFSFFLPAAFIGKIFGWRAANFSLFIWTFIGINLFIFLLFRYLKKANLGIVFVFIFFSGMDVLVSQHLYKSPGAPLWAQLLNNTSIDNWAVGYFEYSSITTQLYYVFNQSLPAWIITIWLLNQKNRNNLLFLFSLLIFFAPFPFIGLAPFLTYKFFTLPLYIKQPAAFRFLPHHFYNRYKDFFTFQNMVSAPLLILIAYLFFSTAAGHHPYGFVWVFHPEIGKLSLVLFLFYLIEFLLLGLLIFPFIKEKSLLKFALISLVCIPFFHYGVWNDFVMRVSIPALLVLNVLTLHFLFVQKNLPISGKLVKILVILILLTGSITSIHGMYRPIEAAITAPSTTKIMDSWKTFGNGGYLDKMENIQNFVVAENKSGLFFQFLLKPDS